MTFLWWENCNLPLFCIKFNLGKIENYGLIPLWNSDLFFSGKISIRLFGQNICIITLLFHIKILRLENLLQGSTIFPTLLLELSHCLMHNVTSKDWWWFCNFQPFPNVIRKLNNLDRFGEGFPMIINPGRGFVGTPSRVIRPIGAVKSSTL